uniref:Uncharacterized protein n=1 Tax=Brassica oleracea TaxID=3712 RepID=A0A3P6EE20_BRAOL|nr:unnamed protein product [Brassica oleracea]
MFTSSWSLSKTLRIMSTLKVWIHVLNLSSHRMTSQPLELRQLSSSSTMRRVFLRKTLSPSAVLEGPPKKETENVDTLEKKVLSFESVSRVCF